ncbi:thermonuclease family protein [Piscinibacter sp.]|jgi:endonuclease YncB( thermonuclease family)|uniref:thermonuclease family protein n=1 Tax=Piscinibacter sp. TaxID=1903157 RepID=UPI002F3F4CF6
MKAGLAVALAFCAATAQAFSGVVTHVTDGDTVWVQPDAAGSATHRKPIKLRLQGIDAPERCQAWGAQAKAALESRVLHQRVRVRTRAKDSYERTLGNLRLAGVDVSAWMVEQGHAWSYRYRHGLGPYAAEERQARAARRGLFADAGAVEPRRFRKAHGPCE